MSDEQVGRMHDRQAAILMAVPAEDRRAVLMHAHFRQNISGGVLSSNLYLAVQALKRAGSAQALMDQDRDDNAKLMASDRAWR